MQWGDQDFCWVIAYWKKTDDGIDLHFIDHRPFDDKVDSKDFWYLAKMGQEMLEEE